MKELFDTFLDVVEALEKSKVEYVLIGGYAVVIHGYPRFTEDMDLFIALEKSNVDRLRQALQDLFNDQSLAELTVEEIDQYPVIRYGAPNGFCIDIIARIGEMYCYDDIEHEVIEIEGRHLRIATPKTLLKMKQDTVRLQDRMDAEFLKCLIEKRKNLEATDGAA